MKSLVNVIVDFSIGDCSNKIKNLEQKKAAPFIFVWISTTFFMWAYVGFSYWVFPDYTVGNLGVLYSIIHTLTPILYRYTNSLVYAGLNISISGLLFQVTFCVFNGGIDSPSAIWFTLHPVIMSFFASKSLIFFSVFLNAFMVLGLTYLGLNNFFPADSLNPTSTEIMRISTLIGLDFLIATYTIVFINKTRKSELELAKRSELIENLMRIIAHDIGNALTVSTLASNLLQRQLKNQGQTDEVIHKQINKILAANKQIQEISNSTREWMKARTSQIPLKIEPVNIESLIQHIHHTFDTIIESKNITFQVESDIQDGKNVLVDSSAFKNHVLNNIISNAIKFTPKDKNIFFRVKEVKERIVFIIEDEGSGITKTIVKSIFDPSRSQSTLGTEGEKGTGLGMPIAKILLEQMNGNINIISKLKTDECEESGTTISIDVPTSIV